MDIPSKQAQESFIFDFEKFSHTAIYGSAGFGKSTILQTLVMNLARQNNPEQVQFNLLDFGTNGLLPLKDLPHVSDLARLEEEEKLIKFVKRIREEINHRKELFTEVGVASLSQYEAKTTQILPVVVTVVDSYDPMRESPLEEGVDSVLNQLLREGASVGMYLILTGIRVDTFKISMTSNIPTRMSLFLVEENAIKDVVGREALIPQEIVGRGQLKLDTPLAVQFYLATKGETDLYRLTALEEEVRTMNSKWAGKRPLPIPMVPKTLTMQDFFESVEVQNYLSEGNLPLGLSLETTEVVGFRPKKDGYFLIVDNEPSQTEYLERTILENFKLLEGKYQRIVFDAQDRFVKETTAFDIVVGSTEFPTFTTEIISEFEGRLALNDPSSKPMLIYIPETLAFSEKSFITEDKLRKLLREGYQVGIHLLFQGEKSKVDNSFNEIIKTLRANVPTGLVGSRLSEQSYVKVKTNYSEPMMEHDQDNYFVGRFAGRMKLVSEE
jgi:S-DNA-T family DNA segregation ATPase FtsK/SpoIIIE